MNDYIKMISDFPVNRKLKSALNKFFNKYDYMLDECIFRKNWEGANYALIIEGSSLFHHLNGYSGSWDIHTEFYNAFDKCGFHPEMMNSCVVAFYKD